MIHGAMGAGQGRCVVANRMESAPTHCVRLSSCPERLSVVDEGVSVGMGSQSIIKPPGFLCDSHRYPVAHKFHTAYDSRQCHQVPNPTMILERSRTTTGPALRSMPLTGPTRKCWLMVWQNIRARRFPY